MQKASIYFLSLITISGTVQPFGWNSLDPRNISMPNISIPGLRSPKPSQEQETPENLNKQAEAPVEAPVATLPEISPTVNLSKSELQQMLAEAVKAGNAEYQTQISELIKQKNGANPQEIEVRKIDERILNKARADYYARIEAVNTELSTLEKKSREARRKFFATKNIEDGKAWIEANTDWRAATKLRLGLAGVVGLKGTADYIQNSPDVQIYREMAYRRSHLTNKEEQMLLGGNSN